MSPRPSPQDAATSFDSLVAAALASSGPLEIELHARSVAVAAVPEGLRQQALLDLLKAHPAMTNVVSLCLFHLRAFGADALRTGIRHVLNQPDGFDTDSAKVSALIRLVGIDPHIADDTLLIAHYAFHSRPELRTATLRELRSLDMLQRQQLLEANGVNVQRCHPNAKALEVLVRAMGKDS